MGYRGPAPKPTVLQIAEGNPGHRKINRDEPQYRMGVPKCPAHLSPEVRKEWRRLAPMLDAARVLTEADYMALANLCQAWVTMQKAQAQLEKTGLLLKTKSGYVQQSPLISIVNSSMEIITKLSREFGLTPASRSRLSAGGGQDDELKRIEEALSKPRVRAV